MTKAQPPIIEPQHDGPLVVKGFQELRLDDGSRTQTGSVAALCRCGASGNKPFCDGSHHDVDWRAED